jgi:tetratricopeptide (TPR) repeat protein
VNKFLAGLSAVVLLLAACQAPASEPAKKVRQPARSVLQATNAAPALTAAEQVEQEYQKLLEADDLAQEDADKWIRDDMAFAEKGGGLPPGELTRRIQEHFAPIRKGYEDFLQRHPEHANARVAYASFLGDIRDEEGAREQLEKALSYDTNNPAIYNNLANIYGHIGPDVKQAFTFYTKAIQLNPREPVYYHNFGTTVYLFRMDAKEYYGINEQQVFDKALQLYSNAMRLDPTNFPLASDIAQTYYGIQPPRMEEGLKSWTNALALAHDEIEREGVYIHFARIKLNAGRFSEAHAHLDAVTNQMYAELKKRLVRNLAEKEKAANKTNAAPAIQPALQK